MTRLPTSSIRHGRLLAVGILALLVLAPSIFVAWMLNAERALSLEIGEQGRLLSRYEARLADMRKGEIGSGAEDRDSDVFLEGDTRAIAGAELRQHLIAIIETAGGDMTESEFIPATSDLEDAEILRLRASMVVSNDALQRILFEAETYRPILLMSSLTIQSSSTNPETEEPAPLLATIVMDGYWKAAGQ